jgi:hypothetical protein
MSMDGVSVNSRGDRPFDRSGKSRSGRDDRSVTRRVSSISSSRDVVDNGRRVGQRLRRRRHSLTRRVGRWDRRSRSLSDVACARATLDRAVDGSTALE